MRFARILGSVVLLAFAGLATAQITASPQGYTFRAKYTKGSVAKYVVKAIGGPKGVVATVIIPSVEKVISVNNTVGAIEVTLGQAVILQNGKPLKGNKPPIGQKETFKLSVLGSGVGQSGASLQTHIEFVAKPIKVGGSWDTSAAIPFGGGVQMMRATYKLAQITTLGNKRVAKLAATLQGFGQAQVSGSGAAWVSMDDGSLVKETIYLNVQGIDTPVVIQVTRT